MKNETPALHVQQVVHEDHLSLLLASSIHEIKNNFGKLVFAINDALEALPNSEANIIQDKINTEIRHISNQLSQVLILYKDYQHGYTPNIDETTLSHLLRETRARHLNSNQSLQIGTDCDADLIAYMDDKFVINLLDTFIYNAQAAGATQILISAEEHDSAVMLTIEDNGPGFAPDLVPQLNQLETCLGETSLLNNNFGLGLFFAQKIVALHKNSDQQGSCAVSNGGRLGGAKVTLYFP